MNYGKKQYKNPVNASRNTFRCNPVYLLWTNKVLSVSGWKLKNQTSYLRKYSSKLANRQDMQQLPQQLSHPRGCHASTHVVFWNTRQHLSLGIPLRHSCQSPKVSNDNLNKWLFPIHATPQSHKKRLSEQIKILRIMWVRNTDFTQLQNHTDRFHACTSIIVCLTGCVQ